MLGFVGMMIFSGTLPTTRIAVEVFSPMFVAAGRAVVAASVAIPVLLLLRRRVPEQRDLMHLGAAATFLIGGFPGFSALAMQHVPVSHGGVVFGLMPLLTAVFGVLLSRERPSAMFWVAAVAGAGVVVAFAARGEGGGTGLGIGDAYLFAAAASGSLGYALSAGVARRMPGWEVISWQVLIWLPITLPLTLWSAPVDFGVVETRHWLSFAYAGLCSMYLGFFFWNAGLAMGGVARVGQVQLLQTFVIIMIAIPVNGEAPDALTWVAAAAVVATVLLGRKAAIRR